MSIYFFLKKTAVLLLLLFACSCGCPKRYIPKAVPDPLPAFYVPEKIRVALVLGSGGVRGMAHVGVIEELENAGIPIDLIVGCSAGSLVGALYADNPCIEDTKRAVWGLKSDSILDINLWQCRYGLSQGKSLNRIIDKYLEAETFDQLKIPLVVVATDLHSGELVPMGGGDLVKSVQASCSIPFFFVPCDYMGRIMVDGGVISPIPVKVARDLGADIIIAVDLSEILQKTFPTNLFEIALRSSEVIFMWQNEACTRLADVVIRPKTCGIGTFNDKMKGMIYQAGRAAAKEKISTIKELLAKYPQREGKCKETRKVELECYTPQICVDALEDEEDIAEIDPQAFEKTDKNAAG